MFTLELYTLILCLINVAEVLFNMLIHLNSPKNYSNYVQDLKYKYKKTYTNA